MANMGAATVALDGRDISRFITSTIGSFTQDHLLDRDQRLRHKDHCAERLAAQDTHDATEVNYADQAVLANLDWGIDAIEEAISTSNPEAKLARLDHAERMLHVCAMLHSSRSTAGVPNSYLSAWAHLNLAFVWKLRNNLHNSAMHALEIFIVDPFFGRVDFAPQLWEALFMPHMGSLAGWYAEGRHRIVIEVIPDSADLSFTADLERFFEESLVVGMRPDQAEKLEQLERDYAECLDEHTRLYARYFKECLCFDPTAGRKGMPMMPIAEPPMTPLHEVSRAIPKAVRFGPLLPKSAGFSFFSDKKESERSSSGSTKDDEPANLDDKVLDEENDQEDSTEYQIHMQNNNTIVYQDNVEMGSELKSLKQVAPTRTSEDIGSGSRMQKLGCSPKDLSPMDTPKAPSLDVPSPKRSPSPKVPSQKQNTSPSLKQSPNIYTKEPEKIIRFLSTRLSSSALSSSLPASPTCNDSSISSNGSEVEDKTLFQEVQRSSRKDISSKRSLSFGISKTQLPESGTESEEDISQSTTSIPTSEKLTPRKRPPKDFVCPITGQLFNDPVTLETGQTYERRAIQEWLERGNTTCPITRQNLSATTLPKTNYVLKRLITSWKEQHPDLAHEFSNSEASTPTTFTSRESSLGSIMSSSFNPIPTQITNDIPIGDKRNRRFTHAAVSTSPKSVISQAAVDMVINELKPYTSCICTSEDLQECEAALLTIAKIWKASKADPGVHTYLAKPTIVNGFVEILSVTVNREVLGTAIYILSELVFADESVAETLTSVDTDFDCLASLLKNGLAEASVLMYQLKPTFSQLSSHDLVPALVQVILNKSEEENEFLMGIKPNDAAIAMLEQILLGGDENSRALNALSVISMNALPGLIKNLDRVEGRICVVSILVCCMRADQSCSNLIANRAELAPVLELFHAGNDRARSICMAFMSELVSVHRRTFCNQVLQIIKDEGAFSTMHAFLVYLQMAPLEQRPLIANILLQLDLLVEPRKMSIYREEAIEALIEALRTEEFPIYRITAVDMLLSLTGRLTPSGKSLTEALLLKAAGVDRQYNVLMKAERIRKMDNESPETMEVEEKASRNWEKRVAFVLANHEHGSIFKALEECLKSDSLELAKSCLVIATWLSHMLLVLPDTGVRDVAQRCLLDQFINVLLSSKNQEEQILAALSLKGFVNDPDALKEVGMYAKSICKPLKKLKKSSIAVRDTLKALINSPCVDATEFWSCAVVAETDASTNSEILSLLHSKGRLFSSHSDGHIKVWDTGRRTLRLIQEAREHTKPVTSLSLALSGEKLYSGSLDKTIRVWGIGPEEIHCIQVYEVKEAVCSLTVNGEMACFISQGTGTKVYNWSGFPKNINSNKHVKTIAMTDDKLYCGCTGYSIQEVDLCRGTSGTFFSGTRKLLGKQTIHVLHINDGLLFAGGSSVDGVAGKVFSLSTKSAVGSLMTGFDIYSIAVNDELIFTGTKCGVIEIWLRERFLRVGSLKVGVNGNAKVTCLAADPDGDMLFATSSDGKIQAWALD
ncbi:putative E3 ubiquitin-protein ligase LIN-1 isoform X1 [Amborella trichopoda]|uniref:putative E3 ubiquitin-protein ligase LIN-1 isoform X1 n=1 Tax=Amborella trichopoda TaxID=13333 RepID=UPI0009BF8C0E|nr:putative E3 ubiquitin-protein ligase LIN-1 isoform X1 [Amborella trichopoda]|eukprot:XP_020527492.1 putative E3 ubiquitin-protein ligase LIN-1 isoform X1 [Amborella trichopoda]